MLELIADLELITDLELIADLNFLYKQLLGCSGWSAKYWLDHH